MYLIATIRQRARVIVGPTLGIALVAYFAYHLVQGDRGLAAWLRLTQEIRQARLTLAQVDAERRPLENRVELLRGPIDRDLVDERARATLDLVGPNEVVLFDLPAK